MIRRLALMLICLLVPSVCLASPITWEFTGYNSLRYAVSFVHPTVQSGDFTVSATFDPDTAGTARPWCANQYAWALSSASLTWGGITFATSTSFGGMVTNETHAELDCGVNTALAFFAVDPVMPFFVSLVFDDPSTVGTNRAPRDQSLITPLYAEFIWGPMTGSSGPFALALGTFETPTLYQPPTFSRLSFAAPEVEAIATPEPMSGLLLGTALGALYLMQFMRRIRR